MKIAVVGATGMVGAVMLKLLEERQDGTISYDGYGVGVMFLPSGLGYFATYTGSIPSYSNLIFKFELMQTETMDHDFDNVPSYMEVVEVDYDLYSNDTDGDLVVDFIDFDDDGDGTATSEEVRVETFSETTRGALEATLACKGGYLNSLIISSCLDFAYLKPDFHHFRINPLSKTKEFVVKTVGV